MEYKKLILPLFTCLLILTGNTIDARRVRVRTRPVEQQQQPEAQESEEVSESEEDNRPQQAIQYYSGAPDSRENIPQNRIVLVSSNDEYNGLYGTPSPRARGDYNRQGLPIGRSSTLAPRTKDQATKSPPVQTIRNYSKVNDDGSFTFGYEAADGSFKEETRGTDCVVRGKYGYIDPDGNKREFTYVSGNPCDPNNPDGQESDEDSRDSSDEDSREPENIPQNYPKRPIRPVPRPHIATTTNAPTTVFQNSYSHPSFHQQQQEESSEEEEPEPIQVLQPQRARLQTSVQPLQQQYNKIPSEITIRQRPRITINTTPQSVTPYQAQQAVSITPRPNYRAQIQTLQTQPPATTYRPVFKNTQTPASISYAKSTPRPTAFTLSTTPNSIVSTTRRPPVDFAAEFQKFQKEHNLPLTTTSSTTLRTTTPYKPFKPSLPVTSNPIYESQLVYDPNSGQYDSALYQQLPQTDGDFSLNHRIQPYVHQITSPSPQLISLDQLQQINLFRNRPSAAAVAQPPEQFSQQIYEKERENLQVLNSQQLFQQQQELQQQQLKRDRIEAIRKAQQPTQHRFATQGLQSSVTQQASPGFYYIQQPSSGQIDAFLRGHNIDF